MEPTAKNIALKRLNAREYSGHELETFLCRKGFDEIEAREAVSELKANGLIDETRYARALIREWANRGKGPIYIRHKLLEKGIRISSEEIRALTETITEKAEFERAKEVLERRYPTYRNDPNELRRAFQGLMRRGFGGEIVRRLLSSRFREEA